MILSNAALNWASLRSGLSLGEFLSSLTPEREREILASYNAWRRSKGLPEEEPIMASTPPMPLPPKPKESDIERLMEQIADEVEKEQEEEAELVEETMEAIDSMPVEWVPEEIVEEVAILTEEEPAEASEALGLNIDEGSDVGTPTEEALISAKRADSEAMVEPAEGMSALVGPFAPAEASLFDRLCAIARTLPKAPDPALYESLLAGLGCSAEDLQTAAEDVRKHFTARHRSTVGIRTFMAWLGVRE